MVYFCCVPGCSNRSNRDTAVSYFGLPLKNKPLLRIWIHKIGRQKLPLNSNTRICSNHFVSAAKRKLWPDEYPTKNLPQRSHTTVVRPRKPPKTRAILEPPLETSDREVTDVVDCESKISEGTQVSDGSEDIIEQLKKSLMTLEAKLAISKFCIENISTDEQELAFYTGFPNYSCFKACYDYLGPAANDLKYWGSKDKDAGHGRSRILSSLNEFFLVMVRLRLGLFERDLAKRFDVSTSTVCRICRTWICFMYGTAQL